MAKVADPAEETAAGKRIKTGGRPAKKEIDQMIADAERRSRLAVLHDDTAVEAELAAFYLILSMSQLRELRKDKLPSEEDKKAARLAKASEAAAKAAGRTKSKQPDPDEGKPKGLRMIKITEKDAIGTNQPVTYLMGDLRRFQKEHAGYGTFEVALAAAGILGWVSQPYPFFAAPKPDRKGRPILDAKGWGMDVEERERRVKAALEGSVRCVWLTPAEALHCLWSNESEHRKFAKPWLALLKEEASATKASIERTAISAVVHEGRTKTRELLPD
ncbi:MAG: hypothetical protein CFE44_06450 [Burkholderiales bacterium PBB4]|nr:MAG: hypothetical protein CFE44_06450 [Burkholderiales bacterium PBB4]